VIVESTHTFVGKEKALYFSENKHLFEKINEKIVHVVVDDFPHKYPNMNVNNSEQWKNEDFQRNCIIRGLQRIDAQNDDILIISDVDEILDPRTLHKIRNGEIVVEFNSMQMDMYYYNLHTKFNDKWNSSKMLSYKKYKELNVTCNQIRNLECKSISNGGWHLSCFGDAEFISNKIKNFSHQEYNNDIYTDISILNDKIKNSKDLCNRQHIVINKIKLIDNLYLPLEYEKYLSPYFNA